MLLYQKYGTFPIKDGFNSVFLLIFYFILPVFLVVFFVFFAQNMNNYAIFYKYLSFNH